jgi:hypothetical protein
MRDFWIVIYELIVFFAWRADRRAFWTPAPDRRLAGFTGLKDVDGQ